MSTRWLIGGACLVALSCGCRTADEAGSTGAAGSAETRLAAAGPDGGRPEEVARTERSQIRAERAAGGATSPEAGGRPGARPDGDPADGLWEEEDLLGEDWPEPQRRAPRARVPNDELAVSLEILSLPDGVYEIDRSTPEARRLWRTQKELDAFLERVNAREAWFQVIRVGPWRIRVVRDTFFDPYRRDSGWIDIDELDGQRYGQK